ncbi:rod shape-determining protein MreC [soil metagenome]|jgi:rod shape-determining protein MreC
MGRKKSNAARNLIVLTALGFVCLVLFTLYIKEGPTGPLHTVQLGAAEVLQPVRSVFGAATKPLGAAAGSVDDAFAKGGEMEQLRKEARENEALAAQASRLQSENDRLRELLQGSRVEYEYAPLAQVVAPVGDQFTERISINVGANDGVAPEQPVVVGNNTLIGRTTSNVTKNQAEVMLITDQSFAAGVRVVPPAEFDPTSGELLPANPEGEASYGEGLLKTDWEGTLGVDFVDLGAQVEKGYFVVTSGRAGDRELLFPPGLFVGTVEAVSSRDIDQYKNIVVDPTANADDLEEVRVIVGW